MAVWHRWEHTHASERKPCMMYSMGVSTPIQFWEEILCAILCGCGVTHTFSRSSVVFMCTMLHGCDYTHVILRLLWKKYYFDSCKKSMGMGTCTHSVQAGMFTEIPTMSRQRYLLKHPQCHRQSRLVFILWGFCAFCFWCHGFECNYLMLYHFILHSFLVKLCPCAWNYFTILKLDKFNSDLIFNTHTTTTTTTKKEKGKTLNVQVKQQLQSSQIILCTIVLTVLMVIIIVLNIICMQVCF